ncbi:gephyrin-like molybdotransferase Glp [Maribacter chungangensis]|uniref:Molybdopterin molybdenumtransferase n=1 Tax=Maribacter chungangensis TaxID=1069117 RepID=A0ABW3B8F0_9FLAO
MIDTATALQLVLSHGTSKGKTMEVTLNDALGFVLYDDVISPMDMPPFRQSAMDGYAVNANGADWYRLVGEVQAGAAHQPKLATGEAVRIFTGAAVPDSATAVIMQEKVAVNGQQLRLEIPWAPEMNIRPQGEQIKKDAVAMSNGTLIQGAHIGFLAGLGITKVKVRQKPSIAIVVTGNELVSPGTPLPYGKIYESNGAMLQATLNELGYKNTSIVRIADDYEDTKRVLQETISTVDVVVITGGVSVGDYDFVGKALLAIGVEQIFHKVKQKPGKPLFFGRKEGTSIFGLPGNPGAALNCFYIYVYPLLRNFQGAEAVELPSVQVPLLSDYTVNGDRAQFLKAKMHGAGVEILDGQSSAMVRAFGYANALVFLPEDSTKINKGELVKTILLPHQ